MALCLWSTYWKPTTDGGDVRDEDSRVLQCDAADNLAAGVRSFLESFPYMAPEMIGMQARVKLAEPLRDYELMRESLEAEANDGRA